MPAPILDKAVARMCRRESRAPEQRQVHVLREHLLQPLGVDPPRGEELLQRGRNCT